jgi:hypothetical protein
VTWRAGPAHPAKSATEITDAEIRGTERDDSVTLTQGYAPEVVTLDTSRPHESLDLRVAGNAARPCGSPIASVPNAVLLYRFFTRAPTTQDADAFGYSA